MGGRREHGLRGQKRNLFISFCLFHTSTTIGMEVFFVITNRLNKQILLQTILCIIKVKTTFWLSQQEN